MVGWSPVCLGSRDEPPGVLVVDGGVESWLVHDHIGFTAPDSMRTVELVQFTLHCQDGNPRWFWCASRRRCKASQRRPGSPARALERKATVL